MTDTVRLRQGYLLAHGVVHGIEGPDVSLPHCALHCSVAWCSPLRNDLQPCEEQACASHPVSQTMAKSGRVLGSDGGSDLLLPSFNWVTLEVSCM